MNMYTGGLNYFMEDNNYLNYALECCINSNDFLTEYIVVDPERCTTYSMCNGLELDDEDSMGNSVDLILFACPVYIELYVTNDNTLGLNSKWCSKLNNHFFNLNGNLRSVAGKLHKWGLVANDNYNILTVLSVIIYSFVLNGFTTELETIGDDVL